VLPSGRFDFILSFRRNRGDRLKGVDWEGIEEFMRYDERRFVFACIYLEKEDIVPEGRNSPVGTNRIFSVQMMGIFSYLLVL